MRKIVVHPENGNWKLAFFSIWTAQAFSLLGSMLVGFALVWWLTKETGSATVLATATLVGMLPQVLLGPIVGALVDRWNRRVIMIVADSTIALATLFLAVLFWAGTAEIGHIYLLMFIRSVAGGFHWPAMQASTSLMVPKEHLSRIQGMNSVLNGMMNIASAPLGALLMELLPMQGVLSIDVVTALIAISPLFFVIIPQPERKLEAAHGSLRPTVWQDFKAGLAYVAGWPGLMIIGLMALMINFLLTPAFSLLPILVTKHFQGQVFQLAWLNSAWGIGVIAGGLLLGVWGGFKRRIYTSMLGLFGMALGCLAMGLMPASAYWLAVVAMFWLGLSNPIANGPLFAVLQSVVDPDMQGRVFTLIGSLASAMSPLGLILAGPLADHLGVQTWFVIGGLVTAGMAAVGLFIPAVVHFEQGRKPVVAEESAPSQPVMAVADGN